MRRNAIRTWMTVLAAVVGLSSTAFADWSDNLAGNMCTGRTHTSRTQLEYTTWGVQNNDLTNPAFLTCGVPIVSPAGDDGVSFFSITGYDRNPNDDLCCTLFVQDLNGAVLASRQACTSSAGPSHYIRSATFSPKVWSQLATLECRLPAFTASHGLSHLTKYVVNGI